MRLTVVAVTTATVSDLGRCYAATAAGQPQDSRNVRLLGHGLVITSKVFRHVLVLGQAVLDILDARFIVDVEFGGERCLLLPRATHDARAHVIESAVCARGREVPVANGARLSVPAALLPLLSRMVGGAATRGERGGARERRRVTTLSLHDSLALGHRSHAMPHPQMHTWDFLKLNVLYSPSIVTWSCFTMTP